MQCLFKFYIIYPVSFFYGRRRRRSRGIGCGRRCGISGGIERGVQKNIRERGGSTSILINWLSLVLFRGRFFSGGGASEIALYIRRDITTTRDNKIAEKIINSLNIYKISSKYSYKDI